MVEAMRPCRVCGVEKIEDAFYKRTDGYRNSECTDCKSTRGRRRYTDRARETRNSTLVRKYGITIEDFEQKLVDQDGVCAICEVKPATDVDHDHDTGAVRDLLCRGCNVRVPSRSELDRVLFYLAKHAA